MKKRSNNLNVVKGEAQSGNFNYSNPPIPEGYEYVTGKWNNGFVIERMTEDNSQFVWVPVEYLKTNGTQNGNDFTEKFGRRRFLSEEFSEKKFYEPMNEELLLQKESVKKYGGFYISRYLISKNQENNMPQSVKWAMPWTYISYKEAKKVAETFEVGETLKSHLPYGLEYDSLFEWIIESNAKSRKEVIIDSTKWGNYWNTPEPKGEATRTGDDERFVANRIYDIAGNVDEWSQEKCNEERVVRGGYYLDEGNRISAVYRNRFNENYIYKYTGYRIALYIK